MKMDCIIPVFFKRRNDRLFIPLTERGSSGFERIKLFFLIRVHPLDLRSYLFYFLIRVLSFLQEDGKSEDGFVLLARIVHPYQVGRDACQQVTDGQEKEKQKVVAQFFQ